jgi:hypothetical protein
MRNILWVIAFWVIGALFTILIIEAGLKAQQTPIQITESPIQSGQIWILKHTPINAGLVCTLTITRGQAPKTLKPGTDYIWWGNNTISPMIVSPSGEWLQGAPWAVPPVCSYSYILK